MPISEYEAQDWENGPAGGTPLNEERLEHIETGLRQLSLEAIAESGRVTVSTTPPPTPTVGDIWIPLPA